MFASNSDLPKLLNKAGKGWKIMQLKNIFEWIII